VKISIFDVIGAEVKTISDRIESPGFREVLWDARSNDGRQVPSGVYFCKIQYEGAVQTMKMMLMK
jgi:flagellar hook assembly protein FlgD